MTASEVRCVEAHGTGTALGDPIEMGALSAVLSGCRQASAAVLVGAVKSNLGHALAASGLLGLVKCVAMYFGPGVLEESCVGGAPTRVGVSFVGLFFSLMHF